MNKYPQGMNLSSLFTGIYHLTIYLYYLQGVSVLWQDFSHTNLPAVIARVSSNGKRLSPVFDSNPTTESKPPHRPRVKKTSSHRETGSKFADTKLTPLTFVEVKEENEADEDLKSSMNL